MRDLLHGFGAAVDRTWGPPLRREVGYGAVLVVGLPTQGSDLAMQAPGHLGVCFRLAGHLAVRALRTRA